MVFCFGVGFDLSWWIHITLCSYTSWSEHDTISPCVWLLFRIRKVWQRRMCVVRRGTLIVPHAIVSVSATPVRPLAMWARKPTRGVTSTEISPLCLCVGLGPNDSDVPLQKKLGIPGPRVSCLVPELQGNFLWFVPSDLVRYSFIILSLGKYYQLFWKTWSSLNYQGARGCSLHEKVMWKVKQCM